MTRDTEIQSLKVIADCTDGCLYNYCVDLCFFNNDNYINSSRSCIFGDLLNKETGHVFSSQDYLKRHDYAKHLLSILLQKIIEE